MTEQTSGPVPELTVAIAAYNERATIMEVLQRVQAVPVTKQIVQRMVLVNYWLKLTILSR